jgi:electron transfer flavoprotein beta subunit
VANPYDEFALEEALKLRDAVGEGEICLFSLDWESVEESVFHGLAMGADRAEVLAVKVKPDKPLHPVEGAGLLLDRIRRFEPDVILCGARAVDDDAAQVGSILADRLGWPQVGGIEGVRFEPEAKQIRAKCRRESVFDVYHCPIPCVLTFLRGAELPRYPSVTDVMSAQSKQVNEEAVEIESVDDGWKRIRLYAHAKERRKEIIEGEMDERVETLLDRIGKYTSVEI